MTSRATIQKGRCAKCGGDDFYERPWGMVCQDCHPQSKACYPSQKAILPDLRKVGGERNDAIDSWKDWRKYEAEHKGGRYGEAPDC